MQAIDRIECIETIERATTALRNARRALDHIAENTTDPTLKRRRCLLAQAASTTETKLLHLRDEILYNRQLWDKIEESDSPE